MYGNLTQQLLSFNNYSTLMAIIAGLNKCCIMRLSKTFKEVPGKLLKKKEELETLMSSEASYKNYRASIESKSTSCIPYIGTTLSYCILF